MARPAVDGPGADGTGAVVLKWHGREAESPGITALQASRKRFRSQVAVGVLVTRKTENQLDVIRSCAVARGLQIPCVFEDSERPGCGSTAARRWMT